MTSRQVNWRLEGPISDPSFAARLQSLFIRYLAEAVTPLIRTRVDGASPRLTGALARSFRVVRVRNTILVGYVRPGRHYYHVQKDGTWPAEIERIVIEAVRATIHDAFRRAWRDAAGG